MCTALDFHKKRNSRAEGRLRGLLLAVRQIGLQQQAGTLEQEGGRATAATRRVPAVETGRHSCDNPGTLEQQAGLATAATRRLPAVVTRRQSGVQYNAGRLEQEAGMATAGTRRLSAVVTGRQIGVVQHKAGTLD